MCQKKISERAEKILTLQALGLKKRLEHTGIKSVYIGLSGGLDSTLALLAVVRAFDMMALSRDNIKTITMPCFGTTKRTRSNAEKLAIGLNVGFEEIDITNSVLSHFKDIGQDLNTHDVTFENGQARERTQVLMDKANMANSLVIGTGDLSELALGWATYNGDHMSNYAINSSVPKTLVRYLVDYEASIAKSEEVRDVLLDILATPVSPELIPTKEGEEMSQKTEDIVGPYILHDFFLYYFVRFSFSPSKILRMAIDSFEGDYSKETIEKWLRVFIKRFFTQQFKRSCIPDGVKIGSVTLSPRGDLRMSSDSDSSIWLNDLEK